MFVMLSIVLMLVNMMYSMHYYLAISYPLPSTSTFLKQPPNLSVEIGPALLIGIHGICGKFDDSKVAGNGGTLGNY
jgi:hypothetical protein